MAEETAAGRRSAEGADEKGLMRFAVRARFKGERGHGV